MVIVVGPTQAKPLLSPILRLSGAISTLPVFTFSREKPVAGPWNPDFGGCCGEQVASVFESIAPLWERALAASEDLGVPCRRMNLLIGGLCKFKSGVPMPFDDPDFAILMRIDRHIAEEAAVATNDLLAIDGLSAECRGQRHSSHINRITA